MLTSIQNDTTDGASGTLSAALITTGRPGRPAHSAMGIHSAMNIQITKQIGGGAQLVEFRDGRTVNVRDSGSLSCRLGGASGRLFLRW